MYNCRKYPAFPVQNYFWKYMVESVKEGSTTDTLLQGLLEKAIENPGIIYGAVRLAEGTGAHCKRVEGVVKPAFELEALVVKSRGYGISRHYDKHSVLRAWMVNGIVRVSEVRLNLTGDTFGDVKQWDKVMEPLTDEVEYLAKRNSPTTGM